MKYIKNFHPTAFQNKPKLAFLVWKYTFRQPWYCSDKGYEDFKGLFQSVEYIHRRTQMITARVAAAVTFYRIESSAL
jgi:hypothetical protein